MASTVLVIGSINVDYTAMLPGLPLPGETLLGADLVVANGGKGANQAVAAARAGADVLMLGSVGGDPAGAAYLADLAAEGIDVSFVGIAEGAKTGTALIFVERGTGENMIAVCPEANHRVSVQDVDRTRDAIADAAVVIAQLELPLETVTHAASIAAQAGTPFLLNPSPMPPDGLPDELLDNVDIFVLNSTEMGRIAGASESDEEAAAKLIERGARLVLLTRGAEGCTVFTAEEAISVPAFDVEAVDAVGAGDAFTGAFASSLAEGRPVPECAAFANAAGALAVTRSGAMPSLPAREQIREFMRDRGGAPDWV